MPDNCGLTIQFLDEEKDADCKVEGREAPSKNVELALELLGLASKNFYNCNEFCSVVS